MNDRWDAGHEGCSKGGIHEMRDAGKEGVPNTLPIYVNFTLQHNDC